jgi:hypothetical protein
MAALPAPAAERTVSTSPGATRITAYGPEGEPGMVVPPAVGVAAAGLTVGRLTVAVGIVAVGAAIVGVAASGVGEDGRMGVGYGVGVARGRLQPVRDRMTRPAARMTKLRFIFLLSVGKATLLILSRRSTDRRWQNNVRIGVVDYFPRRCGVGE